MSINKTFICKYKYIQYVLYNTTVAGQEDVVSLLFWPRWSPPQGKGSGSHHDALKAPGDFSHHPRCCNTCDMFVCDTSQWKNRETHISAYKIIQDISRYTFFFLHAHPSKSAFPVGFHPTCSSASCGWLLWVVDGLVGSGAGLSSSKDSHLHRASTARACLRCSLSWESPKGSAKLVGGTEWQQEFWVSNDLLTFGGCRSKSSCRLPRVVGDIKGLKVVLVSKHVKMYHWYTIGLPFLLSCAAASASSAISSGTSATWLPDAICHRYLLYKGHTRYDVWLPGKRLCSVQILRCLRVPCSFFWRFVSWNFVILGTQGSFSH